MFNVPGHKANANQNHNKISVLLLLQQLLSITWVTINIGKDVEKKDPHTLLVRM
jgi:hypothetical protein